VSASFSLGDIGKRLILGNNAFNRWNGYEIVKVTNATTVEVAEWLGSASSVYWELHGPGSRYMPAEVTGLESWTVDDIPLSPGVNRIHMVARADSQSSLGGHAWLAGDTIEVVRPDPAPSTSSLEVSLDAPAEPGGVLVTAESSISLSGTLTGVSGSATLSWKNNRGGDGSFLTNGQWQILSISLKQGYNRIRISGTDSEGYEVSHILWVVRNMPPETPPRQYLHAYPDSVQSFILGGNFIDADTWPSPRPFLGGVTSAQHGSLSYLDGTIEYTPDPGFVGTDRFTYELSDGFQRSTGVVTLTVGGSLAPETALLDLDFESATEAADLIASAPSGTGFVDDLSSEADGGVWTIQEGALRLTRPSTGGSQSGAGFRKVLPESDALVVRFDLRVTASYEGFWSDLVVIDLGDFSAENEYDDWVGGSQIADNLRIVGRGTQHMSVAQGGVNPVWEHATDGSTISFIWFVNYGGEAMAWQGPDGDLYTVDPHASTLLINGAPVRENLPRSSGQTHPDLDEVFVRIKGNAAAVIEFDNLEMHAISATPESGVVLWRQTEGLAADGSEDAAPAENGNPHLLNYAFGLDSEGGTQHSILNEPALPQIRFENGLNLTFLAHAAANHPGVIYEIEQSDNLRDWTFIDFLPDTQPVDAEWVRMTWAIPDVDGARFFRVSPVTVE
jgi:hypothetical protein